MKKIFLLSIICLFTFSLFAQDEEAAVKKVVEDAYVKGMFINGSAEAVKKGWHEECEIVMFYQNQIRKTPITHFVERFEKNPGGLDKTVTHKFKYVDVTGYNAVAVVEIFSAGKHKYTDYLLLYKFEDGWKISTKTYFDADYRPMKKRTAIKPDLNIFKKYVGKYQGTEAKNFSFEISEEEGKCFIIFKRQGKIEIFAERQDYYFMKVDDVQIEFIMEGEKLKAVFTPPQGPKLEVEKI